MSEIIQSIRGMNDILPKETETWRLLEQCFESCMRQYGYEEIRFPLVENTQLFKRVIGEVTDIVEKEMYSFEDKNGENITLRPEGTAGCLRACLEHGLLHQGAQKLWYQGPMFRYEKPQKGRYRQFHQFGVEVLGLEGFGIEVELLALSQRLWKKLGLLPFLRLELNSLGSLEERKAYKETLQAFFTQHHAELDEDSQRRLHTNPLRILDSKNPAMQGLIAKAPKLLDSLGLESRQVFETLCAELTKLGIEYEVNPRLVRGLDYYSHTVFEWVTDKLGSQATVCGGGRYDALIAQLGGKSQPALGFAMGIERLVLLLHTLNLSLTADISPLIYIITDDKTSLSQALALAEELRDAQKHWRVITHTAGGSIKSQFKKADKSGADLALILGEDELKHNEISVKKLREIAEQVRLSRHELLTYLNTYLENMNVCLHDRRRTA